MKTAVIVGGGVVGLLAAMKVKKFASQVIIVEKDKECGGLLKSISNNNGINFDFGTHIPSETSIVEVNEMLFEEMNSSEWNSLKIIKAGNFFNNELYTDSQFIYLPKLKLEDYQEGLLQLLNSKNRKADLKNCNNLLEYCTHLYGEIYTENIFIPLIKKFLGEDCDKLHPSALSIFSFSRLIPGDAFLSRNLKESEIYDEKLAFSSYNEGVSNEKSFYPGTGEGINKWITHLVDKVKHLGIEIMNDCYVTEIENGEKTINKVMLSNGKAIETDLLIWTANTSILAKLINNITTKAPQMRKAVLLNYVFDCPFLIDNHYINCYDVKLKSFRVTLYSNLRGSGEQEAPYSCTVEVLNGELDCTKNIVSDIKRELEIMGIVHRSANVLYCDKIEIKNAFPILTHEVVENLTKQNLKLNKSFANLIIAGKATGESFFLNESIIDVYNKINAYISN